MAFDYGKFKAGYHDLCKQAGAKPEDGISQYQAANYVASKRKQAAWANHTQWWKSGPAWDNPGQSAPITVPIDDDGNEAYHEEESDESWWQCRDYWDNRQAMMTIRWRPTEDAALESLWRQTRWQDRALDAETLEAAIEDWGAAVIVHILRTELRSLIELDRRIGRPPAWKMIDRRGRQIPVRNPEWADWRRKVAEA